MAVAVVAVAVVVVVVHCDDGLSVLGTLPVDCVAAEEEEEEDGPAATIVVVSAGTLGDWSASSMIYQRE